MGLYLFSNSSSKFGFLFLFYFCLVEGTSFLRKELRRQDVVVLRKDFDKKYLKVLKDLLDEATAKKTVAVNTWDRKREAKKLLVEAWQAVMKAHDEEETVEAESNNLRDAQALMNMTPRAEVQRTMVEFCDTMERLFHLMSVIFIASEYEAETIDGELIDKFFHFI
jgi:hypothetical protein